MKNVLNKTFFFSFRWMLRVRSFRSRWVFFLLLSVAIPLWVSLSLPLCHRAVLLFSIPRSLCTLSHLTLSLLYLHFSIRFFSLSTSLSFLCSLLIFSLSLQPLFFYTHFNSLRPLTFSYPLSPFSPSPISLSSTFILLLSCNLCPPLTLFPCSVFILYQFLFISHFLSHQSYLETLSSIFILLSCPFPPFASVELLNSPSSSHPPALLSLLSPSSPFYFSFTSKLSLHFHPPTFSALSPPHFYLLLFILPHFFCLRPFSSYHFLCPWSFFTSVTLLNSLFLSSSFTLSLQFYF